jgi:hypothetical protein
VNHGVDRRRLRATIKFGRPDRGPAGHNGVDRTPAGIGLLPLFRYALARVGTYLRLAIRSASTVANLAPLTMVSNPFVPLSARRFARAGLQATPTRGPRGLGRRPQ